MFQAQLEQVWHPGQLRLEPQLLRLIDQPRRVAGVAQQQRQQVIATLAPPLLLGLLIALTNEHFGSHAHQFGVGAQLLRLAGNAEHANQALIKQQRQVDPRLHTFEMHRGLRIDFHHPPVGQHQLRAFVAGVDALRLATAEDQPWLSMTLTL